MIRRTLLLAVLVLVSPRAGLTQAATQPLIAVVAHDSATTRVVVDGITVIHRRTNTNLFVANLYQIGRAHV